LLSAQVAQLPRIASQALVTVAMSGYLLGIPYAVFAGVLLAVLWSRSLSTYKLAALMAPLLFALVFLAIVAITILTKHGKLTEAVGPNFRTFYFVTIALGYLYVGIVFVGAWLLARVHILKLPVTAGEHSA
jgi:hypothetical protein